MKERKEYQLKFRLTATLKEQIDNYCAANDMNVSQFIRMACEEVLNNQKEDKNND